MSAISGGVWTGAWTKEILIAGQTLTGAAQDKKLTRGYP